MFNILSFRYQAGALAVLMEKVGEGSSGAGTGGSGSGDKGAGDKGGDKGSGAGAGDDVNALRAANAALEARLAKLEGAQSGKGDKGASEGEDDSLEARARKEREDKDRRSSESKNLEKALAFTLSAKDWLKTNDALLPKTIAGIFEQADKEVYDSATEKAAAMKVGIISEFFNLQENLDLLTENQKQALVEFKKLTKNGKEERVQSVYDSIFEPTFESLKRVRKAQQLKNGEASPSDATAAFNKKMIDQSKKHYLKRGV